MWIHSTEGNAARVYRALNVFGAPMHDLHEVDLATPGIVFQIGVAPIRIDILTSISGVSFEEAWPVRVLARYDDQPIQVLSREHLIKNKLASGRPQDIADVEKLKEA